MRFVPVGCIREGMVSASKILGKNGEVLINSGAVLQSSYVKRMEELGFKGIYIEDDLSADIVITDIISNDLRHKTVKTIKDVFINIENGAKLTREKAKSIDFLVSDIVENIMSNQNLMVNMIDLKVFDDYTFYHSVNVGILSIVVGAALKLNKRQLHNLGLAAMLHDIGKVFIPKEILNKAGKLTEEEFEVMRTHSFEGYRYLREQFELPSASYIGVLQHHERADGTGYPDALGGSKISLFGKIIAIADVYDAFTSNRPYRSAILPSDAVEYIMGASGSIFDPFIVTTFIQKIAPYPTGTCVLTSDRRVGLVVENYSDCCLRPKVKVLRHGSEEVEPYYLDLRTDRSTLDITIVGISDVSCLPGEI